MRMLRILALGAAIGAWAVSSLAGTAGASFQVRIFLNTGGGDGTPAIVGPGPEAPAVVPAVPAPIGTGGAAPGAGGGLPANPGAGGGLPANPGAGGGLPANPGAGGVIAASTPAVPSNSRAVAVRSIGSICTSQTHSDATNATVRVLCSSGQFVSIEPAPGRPFAGTHGGAYRFNFGPGLPLTSGFSGSANLHVGAGTVTALRVMNLNGSASPLEMLVSF